MAMIESGAATEERSESSRNLFRASADIAGRGEYGTLILDRHGLVLSCGTAADGIFATRQRGLIGRHIAEFIPDLSIGGSSPSFSARYLVHLCAHDEWREFDATDANGRKFAVKLCLSRIVTDGRELFLLNVRRLGAATAASPVAEDRPGDVNA